MSHDTAYIEYLDMETKNSGAFLLRSTNTGHIGIGITFERGGDIEGIWKLEDAKKISQFMFDKIVDNSSKSYLKTEVTHFISYTDRYQSESSLTAQFHMNRITWNFIVIELGDLDSLSTVFDVDTAKILLDRLNRIIESVGESLLNMDKSS